MKKDNLKKIEKDFSLESHNSMGIKCIADYFMEIKNESDIAYGINFARENRIPYFVLGKGSNIILPKRYKGLVIFMATKKIDIKHKKEKLIVFAQAGVFLPDIAKEVSYKGGAGLEWAGGVPGTIGGAVRGNAGAFGDFISDYISRIDVFDIKKGEKTSFEREDLDFGYRESFFKKTKRYIVLGVEMEFPTKKDTVERYQEYLDYREKNHPQEPSAGSIFKNPKTDKDILKDKRLERFEEIGFVPARFLIEEAGLKGKIIGGAQVSEKHPNFIINIGGATKEDIEELIETIKRQVKDIFGIEMSEEVDMSIV